MQPQVEQSVIVVSRPVLDKLMIPVIAMQTIHKAVRKKGGHLAIHVEQPRVDSFPKLGALIVVGGIHLVIVSQTRTVSGVVLVVE